MIREHFGVILIVEDNDDNRLIYSSYLEHVGYRVFEPADGWTAIAMTHDKQPDLVLMDVSIPGIDGLEVTRRLKADAATRTIPIIALTAHALAEDRLRALEAGCDGYLSKPIEPPAVIDEVARILGERRARRA